MALTYTPSAEKTKLPAFQLKTVDGKVFDSEVDTKKYDASVFVFMCNHCPYVKAIEDRLITLANDLAQKNILFVGICSNDASEYPEDAPAKLLERWKEKKYGFPYLVDTEQTVAKAMGAVCTPDFFGYDRTGLLSYRGRLDDSWKDASKVTKRELYEYMVQLAQTGNVNFEQHPSMGCSIKWLKA